MKKGTDCGKWVGRLLMVSGISLLAMWCFFDFSVWSLGILFFLPWNIKKEWKKRKQEQKESLVLACKDALVYLKNAWNAGYAAEGGMKVTLEALEQLYPTEHPICREFRFMISQMELGRSLEEVWLEFGVRSNAEDIRQFAELLSVVKRTGGNLGAVLRRSVDLLQRKIELKRELQMVLAAKEMEFHVMCALPYGILAYLKLFAPTLSEGLYHNFFGIVFMWAVYLACRMLKKAGEKMIYKELLG